MLKFLENRKDGVSPSATGIQRRPSIVYGVSVDSPQQFVNKYTTINHTPNSNTVSITREVNPHLQYQQLRVTKMSQMQKEKISKSRQWLYKTNINLIEECGDYHDPKLTTNYHVNHKKQIAKNSSRFKLAKGEFTFFIDKQHKNQILGPLQGQQRTLDRARQTKLNLREESISSLNKLKSNPSLISTYRPSSLWNQKKKLRQNRQLLHNSMKIQQQTRRYKKSPDFQLPKVMKKVFGSSAANTQRKSFYFNTLDAGSSTVNLDNFQNYRHRYKQ